MIRTVVAVAAAATMLPAPATAAPADQSYFWPAEPSCAGEAVSTNTRTMSLYVTLTAVPPPVPLVPHRAWCDVYVNGMLVGSIEGDHVGFVIVGHGVIEDVPIGAFSFCGAREDGAHQC